ncbi:MAG: phosphotransferase [Promethearchaeota archaeon]|jgi:hypothetical protein
MKSNKIITDIGQLTPEWLTSIFKKNGYLCQGKIIDLTDINSLRPDIGSTTYSCALKFSEDAQKDNFSSKIVIKVLADGETSEAKFYSIVAKHMPGMPIPICYDVAYSEETGASHVILENFSETHYQYSDYPPSKQIFKKAIDSLAEIHAYWWDNKKLNKLLEHSASFYPMKAFKEKQNLLCIREQEKFLQTIDHKISEHRKKLLRKIFALFPRIAHKRYKKGNITLIHNDAHTYNFYFPKDSEDHKLKAILFDWEAWSIDVGCQDLVYMIGFWYFPDYRHLVEKGLIKYYHTALLDHGVKNYSWDECWDDYRLYALISIFRIVRWYDSL